MQTAFTFLSTWVLGAALVSPALPAPNAAPTCAAPGAPVAATVADISVDASVDADEWPNPNPNPNPQPTPQPNPHPNPHPRPRPDPQGPEQTERLSRTFAIGANGSLFLNNISGDIEIKAGSGNEIRIEALKHGKGSSDEDARRQLQNINVTMNEVSGRVEIKTYHAGRTNRGWVDFTILVPASTHVEVQSVSGDLQLHGLKGELRAETASGDVTGSGLGRVSSLKTLSGSLRINGVESDGNVSLSAVSGEVTVENLKARSVDANSVSGDVTLKGCACNRVHLESVSGDLKYVGQIDKAGRYEIKTHSGGIQLAVPASAGFEVEANSFSGDIRFDPPITSILSQGRGHGMGQLAHGVVGSGGASVELSSFSGDILVNRGK
jgi:DUF4097 and DUF4098 domain-containing protein YvlB